MKEDGTNCTLSPYPLFDDEKMKRSPSIAKSRAEAIMPAIFLPATEGNPT
jgi:hypothetical protein